MAAALAGTLAKMGRHVSGVDAPVEAADAFAAAWSQRSRASIRVHRHCRVYRLTAAAAAAAGAGRAAGADGPAGAARPVPRRLAAAAVAGLGRRLRPVTAADRGLLIDLLVAYGIEAGERIGSPPEVADDLISYGGAVLWEVPQRTSRIKEAAHYLVSPQHRDAAQQQAEPALPAGGDGGRRPSGRGDGADQHRLHDARAPPQRPRGRGDARGQPGRAGRHGAGQRSAEKATEVVLIASGTRSDRRAARLGYQLVGERAVLRFGPSTGSLPKLQSTTRPMPRLPTGPLPRLRR